MVKEVTWVVIKLYALYEILSGIESLFGAFLISTQLIPSDYTAISYFWPGLRSIAIGLLLLIKTGFILKLIYGAWDVRVNGHPSSNQASQLGSDSAPSASTSAPAELGGGDA